MRTQESGRILKSSSTTLEIVDAVVELEGARVSQIADRLGISESAASNHLHTLRRAGYLTTEGDIYQPGLKLAKLGEHAKTRDPAYRHAIEVTNDLDERTNFETSFTVEENGLGRYLRPEVDATTEVDTYFTVGERMYLHTTAAGKAILANYSEERVEFILDRWGLPEQTEKTITSRERLQDELDEVRERGYALNRGEDQEGVYAIGQAAKKPSGAVLGAISIAGPTYRTKKGRFEERFTDILDEHIEKLETRLK
ncbi:IclR family transcriptional regulator [Halobellus sp. EA9]|uniref:IclR family transcriptional regulator n=1 Tax=Halobellus sp. EA9 TaxID=3421647 RepID=UPI003EBE740F